MYCANLTYEEMVIFRGIPTSCTGWLKAGHGEHIALTIQPTPYATNLLPHCHFFGN